MFPLAPIDGQVRKTHCRTVLDGRQFCEWLKFLSSTTERLWHLCEVPAGACASEIMFSLSLKKIQGTGGLEAFQHRGRKGGKGGNERKKIPSGHMRAWKCHQRKLSFYVYLLTPGSAARLNFWVFFFTSSKLIQERGNSGVSCNQAFKVDC